MRPLGSGKPVLAMVEVERGKYKLADLRAKWERALRCYPPRMIYVVAPNTSTRDNLRREWKEVLGKVKARYGLPEGADAAFYTVEELVTVGLLSSKQLTKLVFRQRHARETGEALPPRDAVDLPPFWCEKKSRKKGKQRELGLG